MVPIRSKLVPNVPKCSKIVLNFFLKCSQMIQRDQNFMKWFKLAQNDSKWPKMVLNSPKLSKRVPNGPKCSKMAQHGPKWSKIVQHGPKCSNMVQNRPKWSNMISMVKYHLKVSKTVQNDPKWSTNFRYFLKCQIYLYCLKCQRQMLNVKNVKRNIFYFLFFLYRCLYPHTLRKSVPSFTQLYTQFRFVFSTLLAQNVQT